jgi:ribosomal protein S18 acetylase RimI-like enzyme
MMEDSLTITMHGKDHIPDLEPLWKALQQRHIDVGSSLGPTRSLDESWKRRRVEYEKLIEEEGTFILLARFDDKPVGYAFVGNRRGSCSFETPDKCADLHTLSVLPEYRGKGIGDALLNEMFRVLRSRGITQYGLGVVNTNDRAIKFYERYGMQKRYLGLWGDVPDESTT